MPELAVQHEVERIVAVLSELTGLPSRWNGTVELVQDARILGRKPFTCRIVINAGLIGQPVRWRTLIHEALHSFSAGYNSADYQEWRGWEEGVVEQLQRLFRPRLLDSLGIRVDEDILHAQETGHPFNEYIDALEELRRRLAIPAEDFYLTLLKTPIKSRPGYVVGLGSKLPDQERKDFIRAFSMCNTVLKRKATW